MGRTVAHRPIATVAGAILAGVLLTATLSSCAGSDISATAPSATSTATTFATAAKKQLEKLAGVDSVTVSQAPLDTSSNTSPNPADVSQWNVALDVRMLEAATPAQVAAAATATYDFSTSHVTSAPWTASILAGGDAVPYAKDTGLLPAVQVQVFPTKTLSAAQAARAAVAVKKIAGVDQVSYGRSLASVSVLDVTQLATVYDQAQRLPLFRHGGSYSTMDGRVQIMDVPARISDASIHAIIDLGVHYPGANIALTAPTQGQQYPELYLDRVSAEEASAITATLSGLDRTSVTKGDYPLPFHLRQLGGDVSTDVSGFFGGQR